jgi:hypothetical protein
LFVFIRFEPSDLSSSHLPVHASNTIIYPGRTAQAKRHLTTRYSNFPGQQQLNIYNYGLLYINYVYFTEFELDYK